MYDNDRRLADHFGGKLHIGFVTIREKIKLLEVHTYTQSTVDICIALIFHRSKFSQIAVLKEFVEIFR